MEDYKIFKDKKEDEKRLGKELIKPIIAEGVVIGIATASSLNMNNITSYLFKDSSYNWVKCGNTITALSPMVFGILLLSIYKEKINTYIKYGIDLPKEEYYLENKEIYNDYNNKIDNGTFNGNKITFDNVDSTSMDKLQKAKNATCDYAFDNVINKPKIKKLEK